MLMTLTFLQPANGTLSDPNASTDGSSFDGGVFAVNGTAAELNSVLDGLTYTLNTTGISNVDIRVTNAAGVPSENGLLSINGFGSTPNPMPVPEPASLALLASSLAGLALTRRLRRSA